MGTRVVFNEMCPAPLLVLGVCLDFTQCIASSLAEHTTA